MTNFLPIFPLGLVVYPGEDLNLHIFEDKYKEMISDCISQHKDFGIVSVIDQKLSEYGTLMSIEKVAETYSDGRLDIKTRGQQVFKTLELMSPVSGKLYMGAIVNYPENNQVRVSEQIRVLVKEEVKRLLALLDEHVVSAKQLSFDTAYDIGHKVGLTLQQEYELLKILNEDQRQEFVRRHLNNIKPILIELENLKARIKLNGHFKHLTGADFQL